MSLLTRYLQLNDSGKTFFLSVNFISDCQNLNFPDDTHVFYFVVTKSVTRDLSRDVVSREFSFACHRWALSFSREEKVQK